MEDAKEAMTVPKKEQNAGVALLLERMKTNPEEFVNERGFAYSKWGSLIGAFKEHLDIEDQETITNALNTLLQQKFTEKVLEELVDPKSEKSQWGDSSVTLSAGATQGVTLTDTRLHQLLHAKAQMEQERKKLELEQHKAKQVQRTLVGRLKNYLHNE